MSDVSDSPAGGRIADLVESMVSAWNEHDLEKLLDCFAEDACWDDPGMGLQRPARGKEALRSFALSMWRACPDLHYSVIEPPYISSDPSSGRIALHWRLKGTLLGPLDPPGFAPTKRDFESDGVDLVQFDDGKIVRVDTRFDVMDMMQQIGLLPPLPASGSLKERLVVFLQRLAAWLIRLRQR